MTTHQTLSWLKYSLSKRGIRPNRRLGQNFLIDQNILRFIVRVAKVSKEDIVLEIGAGTGALTQLLQEVAKRVIAIEIDPQLYRFTCEILGSCDNVLLINKDIIHKKGQLDPGIISEIKSTLASPENIGGQGSGQGLRLKVVSNLPYCISTPVIIGLLESGLSIELMVLTLQREIASRLAAKPSSKDYGILSVIAQYFSMTNIVKSLPPDVFWPNPRVDSAIIMLQVYKGEEIRAVSDYRLFQKVVKSIFNMRRKALYNSLMNLDVPLANRGSWITLLEGINIDPHMRGEALSVEQIIELTDAIHGGRMK